MKAVIKTVRKFNLILICGLIFSITGAAQETEPKQRERIAKVEAQTDASSAVKTAPPVAEEKPAKEKKSKKKSKKKSEQEQKSGDKIAAPDDEKNLVEAESAVLPYYNNYLNEYRLGPNDVISVEVFGQCPDYCKTDLTVPPNAKISYPLIRNGVLVGGKTVEDVAVEITKYLDEYIIDPKVNVTLVKAMSARYSVLGKVLTPGVRVMDRKVSLYEAIVEAGGTLKDGDRKRVTLYRYDQTGRLAPQTYSLVDMERGKAPMIYLNPGDQVFVPDQGFKLNPTTIFKILEKTSIVRLLFGVPF